MYLCIYIATCLHTVYLDWLQAVLESNSRCAWKWRLSDVRDALGGRDRASLEMQLEIEIEWTQRCTGRPWSSEFGDRDWVNSEMHLKAVIERVWRCTGRPWSSEFGDSLGGRDRVNWEMHLEAVIDRDWRCTGRPWSTEFGDAIGDRDWVNWEMHLEAVIERVWRCTGRPWSSEFGDAIGDQDWVNWEMHLEAVIERVWRCTGRPWSSEFGDALVAGYDRARLEEYLEVVNLEAVDLEAVDGRRARCWDSIHRLVNSKPWECDEVTLPLKLLWRTGWWRSISREAYRKLKLHSGVNSKSWEWRDDRQS